MFRLLALCCKHLYILTLPLTSLEQFSQLLEILTPRLEVLKNPHQIKHNSQLLRCDYFFSGHHQGIVCPKLHNGASLASFKIAPAIISTI